MKPSKFVPYSSWSRRSRGATRTSHPIGSTKGTTLHWEGPKMGSFPHSACDDKVRSIQAFHRDSRGWADIAYNALVCPHGYVFEGRGLWTQSAANGTSATNDDWYAICYIGGDGDPFTDAGKKGFFEAIRWFRTEGGAPDRVNGHRDHKATACPGDAIYRWLRSTDFTPPPPAPAPKPTVTSDVRFVLANVRSNPLMSPTQAREDYELAFAGARTNKAQSVYINEYHKTYAAALAETAKKYGYKVRAINAASGLAVATKITGWTLDGIAFSLLAGGIPHVSPNRGVLRVGEKTPAGTRIVWDDIMLPRGWNNPRYAQYAKTSTMAREIFKKLKPIIVGQTGSLKSVAVLAGDVNQGSAVDWERHLGLKPAATVVRTGGTALDKMMQAAVFTPAGWTAQMVTKIDVGNGDENTDHGILFCHVRVTRPR